MKNRLLFIALFSFQTIAFLQIPTSWSGIGIGGGGALFSPSINPNNSSEFYIACDMGGMYQSTDQGSSWKVQAFQQIRGGSTAKVNFTSNPLIRYSANYTSGLDDFIRPSKSIDGGQSWTILPGNPDDYDPIYSLYANYDNPNQVIINNWNTVFFSNDGGNTFTQVYVGVNSGAGCKLSGVYWDGNSIYCGTNDGILRSTDGGNNFSIWSNSGIDAGEVIVSFAGAKESATTRFYILTASENDVYNGDDFDYYEYGRSVYSMDNLSGTWNDVTSNFDYTQDYMKFLRLAKNEIDVVYLAGSNSSGVPSVLKSSNAGTSWTSIFNTSNNQNIATAFCGQGGDYSWGWAELLFGIDVNPSNSNELLVSDYGFIHKSVDAGASWTQVYCDPAFQNAPNSLITPKQEYKSAGDLNQVSVWQMFWQDSLNLWAATSDIRGTRSTNGGETWSFNFSNHSENTSYRVTKNTQTNTLYMATASVHDLYQSTRLANAQLDAAGNTGFVKFSTDNGLTWQVMKDFSDIVSWVEIDPNNQNRLYASVVNSTNGNGGIWVTNNANLGSASTWTQLPSPPRTEGHPFSIVVLTDGKVVVSYNGHRNPGFTNSSGVFLYDPNTNSWSDRSDVGMQYWTQDVIVDPHDVSQNTWYAAVYDGWGIAAAQNVGGIYKTTDRGLNWTHIWSNERCMSATISPTNPNEMFITTEYSGLFHTANLTATSPTITQTNFPFRNTVRTFYHPYKNEVWVTTFGGGTFKGDFTSSSSVTEITKNSSFGIYPNPTTNQFTIDNKHFKNIHEISLLDLNGKEVYSLNQLFSNSIEIQLPENIENGIYLLKILTDTGVEVYRLQIQKSH